MAHSSFLRSMAFAAGVLLSSEVSALASPWAEVGDNQLRSDIELLAAAGVIEDVTTQWPLPWKSVMSDLNRQSLARQPAAVQTAARRVMAQAEAGTAQGYAASVSLDATNTPSVVYSFDGMGRGEGQAQFSLDGTSGIFSGRISLGAITQNFRRNTFKLMPDDSYVSAQLGGVRVYAGYLDHWWGPGQISALQLSNNARPMPQVGIERSSTEASSWPVLSLLGPWQAEFFLGYLDGPRIQSDTYYSALRVTIHPLDGLEMAIARTEEFCGQEHSCVPFRDYFQFSNNPVSVNNTNDQLAFDFKYSHTLGGIPFQAYMQLMNEDYSWFNHSVTSHLFGTSLFLPTGVNPVKLTAEYTNSIATLHPFSFGDDSYGSTYTNYSYLDGMRYRGRTLGFSLDGDSTLLSLQGSWTDPQGRFFQLSIHHATIGSSHSAATNIVSPVPVLLNMGEARITLPWRQFKLDLAGRVQDNQPWPHSGFDASIEAALRVNL
jgi:hypothetical protein